MKYAILLSVLLLASCVNRLTDDQILALNNDSLCAAIKSDTSMDIRLVTVMNARGLSCHPFQIFCKNAGLKPGTKAFQQCTENLIVQKQAEQAEAQEMARNMGNAFKDFGDNMQRNRPRTTNCYGGPYNVSCTTY